VKMISATMRAAQEKTHPSLIRCSLKSHEYCVSLCVLFARFGCCLATRRDSILLRSGCCRWQTHKECARRESSPGHKHGRLA
jgi:hypothetical protein